MRKGGSQVYGQLPTTGFTGALYAIIGLCLTVISGIGMLATRLLRAN